MSDRHRIDRTSRGRGRTRARRRHAGALVAAIATLALAGACSTSGDDSASSSDAPAEFSQAAGGADADGATERAVADDAAPATGAGGQAPGGGVDPDAAAATENQQLILTGSITVIVDDLDRSIAQARRLTEGAGGLVFGEDTSRTDAPRSILTLKVPPDAFEQVLGDLSELGEADDRRIGSEDVTSQVVDLDSRIATAEASVDRLRALIVRAEDIDDIAVLESQLLDRETTLEQLRGQRRALGDQVALATITVTLTPAPDSPDVPRDEPDELPGFLEAFEGGWEALLTVGSIVALVLFALAPWVPVAVAVGVVIVVIRRWARRRRPAVDAADPTGPTGRPAPAGPPPAGPPPPPPSSAAPPPSAVMAAPPGASTDPAGTTAPPPDEGQSLS